jgi:hypothetical protein
MHYYILVLLYTCVMSSKYYPWYQKNDEERASLSGFRLLINLSHWDSLPYQAKCKGGIQWGQMPGYHHCGTFPFMENYTYNVPTLASLNQPHSDKTSCPTNDNIALMHSQMYLCNTSSEMKWPICGLGIVCNGFILATGVTPVCNLNSMASLC